MKRRTGSSDNGGSSSSRDARDLEERERLRREWRREQELMRQHERLRREKIEEYERKRRAQEREKQHNENSGRSSHPGSSGGRFSSAASSNDHREEIKPGTSKNTIMSDKCQSSNSNARLFQGPEGTKIDLATLRHIKVAIRLNLGKPETNTELQRDIVDPEAIKVKRRDGEGAKPIFEREELKKPIVPVPEVEERRTVLSCPPANDETTERRQRSTRKRSASPGSSPDRKSGRRYSDDRDLKSPLERKPGRRYSDDRDLKSSPERKRTSRNSDGRDLRYESSRRNMAGTSDSKSYRQPSESDRGRSRERNSDHGVDDRRHRSSPRRSSRDASRDHRDRRRSSRSTERESQRNESRNRSSRELPRRGHRERSRDDSRDRRNRDDRSRERRIQVAPHHYAEAMPVPLYYESFPPRPIMIGPMMPIGGQIPMGRGGMRPLMGPMRPPYPPRFFPHEMYRTNPHPNPRFSRMF